MPSTSRSGTFAVAIALAACSSEAPAPRACESAAECPADARCVARACVANAPPVAAIALPQDALETHVLLTFDGSGSADPDADDAVVAWGWTFRALDAPCAAPEVASAEPLAKVRFACAGRYAADLTVTDQLARSASRTEEFDVVPLAGVPLVTAGADLGLDHVCTTLPTRCAPAGEVTLSAAAPSIDSPDLAFAWTVEPPANRPLEAGRRVAFTPSALVAAPSVSIETDGQAISGDWIFRVEARDGAGVVGVAATRVSVGNRAPVVQKTLAVPDHAFDGTDFTASGEIPFAMSDPDGDALFGPEVAWHHAGDGDATFSGALLDGPPRVTFSIAVPYGAPDDALHLIGGEGLERSIAFTVTDVNDAVTSEVWPVVVGNRRPSLVSTPAAFSVNHAYDAAAQAYRASVPLSSWSDPDGDPLRQIPEASTGDPECAAFAVEGGAGPRSAIADCVLAFQGTPAVGNFAGTHVVGQQVQDPWTAAEQTSTVTFTIGNRPPAITSVAAHVVSGSCTSTGGCCRSGGAECLTYYATALARTSVVPSRWSDPDGDPLDVRAAPAGFVTPAQPLVCTPAECALSLELAAVSLVCESKTSTLATEVSDGLAGVSGALPVERACESL